MDSISPFKDPRSNSSISSAKPKLDPIWRKQGSFTELDGREAGEEELTVEVARHQKETASVTTGKDHGSSLPTQMIRAWGGLTRQSSMTKGTCLCSPTTHAGFFRCRIHRIPSLQRTKSIDASLPATDSPSKTDTDAADCDMGASEGN